MRATSHWGPGYILTIPHTIISPLIRRDAPGHVWGLSTRRLIQRRVRPHTGGLATFSPALAWLHSHQPSHNHISPHTSGRTRPRMGSVNTPANPKTRATSHWGPGYILTSPGLTTFSPAITQSYLPSYVGMHPASYGVCQHNHNMGGYMG
ncbi:unnamed protein product [Prunus armeniaca]